MKIILKYKLILLVYYTIVSSTAFSQNDIKVNAQLDSNKIIIGQQVPLKLTIHYRVDKGQRILVNWPQIKDTIIKQVEVVSESKIDTIIPDKNDPFHFVQTKTLYITSFDSGYWAIPPFNFTINSDSNKISTDALLLQVNTVAVDTTLAIKPIKPPFKEDYTFMDWIKDNIVLLSITIGGIILLSLFLYFLNRYYKNKPAPPIIEAPAIPAHFIAFEKLEKLKAEMLWQNGKLKQYHSQLTDIVREYIEKRYYLPALEQTTDEIIFSFRNVAVDSESMAKLKQMLLLADLVKFAKELPLPNENELSLSNAYDFINGTKKEDIQVIKGGKSV